MNIAQLWSGVSVNKQVVINSLREFGDFLRWKESKSKILEIGCAEGSITRNVLFPFVEEHAEKLVAIDLLDDMIISAKKTNNFEQIVFKTGDIMDRKFIEETRGEFDFIFSLFTAQLIPDTR